MVIIEMDIPISISLILSIFKYKQITDFINFTVWVFVKLLTQLSFYGRWFSHSSFIHLLSILFLKTFYYNQKGSVGGQNKSENIQFSTNEMEKSAPIDYYIFKRLQAMVILRETNE